MSVMFLKIAVILCVAAGEVLTEVPPDYSPHETPAYTPVSATNPAPAYPGLSRHSTLDYPHVTPKYTYKYEVGDDYSGANFGHSETRDGYKTEGNYKVDLPDGRKQTVTYLDNGDGLVAKVTYEGEAQDQQYEPSSEHKPVLEYKPEYKITSQDNPSSAYSLVPDHNPASNYKPVSEYSNPVDYEPTSEYKSVPKYSPPAARHITAYTPSPTYRPSTTHRFSPTNESTPDYEPTPTYGPKTPTYKDVPTYESPHHDNPAPTYEHINPIYTSAVQAYNDPTTPTYIPTLTYENTQIYDQVPIYNPELVPQYSSPGNDSSPSYSASYPPIPILPVSYQDLNSFYSAADRNSSPLYLFLSHEAVPDYLGS